MYQKEIKKKLGVVESGGLPHNNIICALNHNEKQALRVNLFQFPLFKICPHRKFFTKPKKPNANLHSMEFADIQVLKLSHKTNTKNLPA